LRLARSRGAARVFLADLNEARLAEAADLVKPDATICSGDVVIIEAVSALTDGRGVDDVLEALRIVSEGSAIKVTIEP
jgi:L-iditol 2-dehydrogenase